MKYVSDQAAVKAREMARRFRDLDASAGVIFVSVCAVPVEGGDTNIFDVTLGMSLIFDPNLGISLTKKVLENELKAKEIIIREVTVFRGISGAAVDRGDEVDERARPH